MALRLAATHLVLVFHSDGGRAKGNTDVYDLLVNSNAERTKASSISVMILIILKTESNQRCLLLCPIHVFSALRFATSLGSPRSILHVDPSRLVIQVCHKVVRACLTNAGFVDDPIH